MNAILQLVSPSPFPSFQSQASAIQAYLWHLERLRSAVRAGRSAEVEQLCIELADVYSAAAEHGRRALDALKPGRLFPWNRERLIAICDDAQLVLDTAQELADRLVRRPIDGPAELAEPVTQLVQAATEMACLPVELVRRLRRLVQFGLGGLELDLFVVLLRDARSEQMRIQAAKTEIERRLNASGPSLPALSIVHVWEVLSLAGQLVARAARLADHLELLIGSTEPRAASTAGSNNSARQPESRVSPGGVDWRPAPCPLDATGNEAAYDTMSR